MHQAVAWLEAGRTCTLSHTLRVPWLSSRWSQWTAPLPARFQLNLEQISPATSHPKYGKIVVKTTKFKAHDEEDKTREGDRVKIRETRPLSRTKRWEIVEILSSSSEA